MTHLQTGNSYGILLKEKHCKFPQHELGPWVADSRVVGDELEAPRARGLGTAAALISPPAQDPARAGSSRRSGQILKRLLVRSRALAPMTLVDSFTPQQVESFDRDGFLIVEEGLVSDRALELLRARYERLFDGEYETGIKPDEVNWVPGRDPEDRTRQICNGWRADNVIAAQVLSERTGRLGAQLARLPGHADPAGQRPVEAARDEGDRLPPGLLVRRLPRARRDAHVLDLPPRDDRGRRPDRVRARLAPLAEVAARALAVPRAGGLARPGAQRRPGGHRARDRPGGREGGRRRVPPRPHLARVVAEHERVGGADGARHPHAAGRGALPRAQRRPDLLALQAATATSPWTSRSSRCCGTRPATGRPGSPTCRTSTSAVAAWASSSGWVQQSPGGAADYVAATAGRRVGSRQRGARLPRRRHGAPRRCSFSRRGRSTDVTAADLPFFVLVGAIGWGSYACFYRALAIGPISVLSPIVSGYAMVTLLLAIILLGERLGTAAAVAVIVSVIRDRARVVRAASHLHDRARSMRTGSCSRSPRWCCSAPSCSASR